MRTKFLLIIVCFVFVSVAISSCLDSDTQYEFSSDATVHTFALDTIHGKKYKFEIDQIQRLIFNRDSLPMDADTIIDSIMIDTFSVYGNIVSGPQDTLLDISNAQDLLPAASASGMTFRIYAPDNLTSRTYTLQINIHKEDPDSMSWVRMTSAPVFNTPEGLKAVTLNDDLLIYPSGKEVYTVSTIPPSSDGYNHYGVNLPEDVVLGSIINVGDGLMANTKGGDVYTSNDGIQWERSEALSGNIISLLAYLPANDVSVTSPTLCAIQKDEADGRLYFCSTDTSATGWTQGEEVPTDFPVRDLSSTLQTTSNGLFQIFLVGSPDTASEQTTPWVSMDGLTWVDLHTETGYCPPLATPYIIGYDDALYILGGDMSQAYTSDTGGIVWEEADSKFWLPEEFASNGSSYTIVHDRNDFIWVIWAGEGTNVIWRGCMNKLKKF